MLGVDRIGFWIDMVDSLLHQYLGGYLVLYGVVVLPMDFGRCPLTRRTGEACLAGAGGLRLAW